MQREENGKKRRYAICKDCREKWNIAINQDTSGGYPDHVSARSGRKKNENT